MVPQSPPSTRGLSTHSALAETPRPLRVFRSGGQRNRALAIQSRRLCDLAIVAQSTIATGPHDLGTDAEAHQALPAPGSRSEEITLPSHLANLLHEEPDAVVPHVRICGGPGTQTGATRLILLAAK